MLKKANESLQRSWNEMNKMYSTANTRRVDAENENGSICKQLDDLNDAHTALKTQHAAQKETIVNLQKANQIVNVQLDEATADARALSATILVRDEKIAQLQQDLVNAQNANSGMVHGLQSILSGSSK